MEDRMEKSCPSLPPPIIRRIGLHLSRPHLVPCLRVCSAWRNALEPIFWETLSLQNQPCNHTPRQPTPTLCLRNRHHIRHLVETGTNSLLKFLAFSTAPPRLHLTSIRVSLLSPEILIITQQNADTLTTFSCRSNRLRRGETDQEAQALWYRQLFMVLETIPQLMDLSIGPAVLIDSPTTVFSKVAGSLKRLELDRVKVADRSWYDDPIQSSQAMSALAPFPELETLVVVWNDLPPQCQLEFIRKSPKLKSLTWKRGTQLLFNAWLSSALPAPDTLTTLDVAHSHIEDKDMARVLAMVPRLSSLNVRSSPFGVQSCVHLLEHQAPYMRMLDVSDCPQVTSAMVVAMLSCMPALVRFCADRVDVDDIAKSYLNTLLEEPPFSELVPSGGGLHRLAKSRPWACLDLVELDMTVTGLHRSQSLAPALARRYFYEQLSKMTRLEVLCLGEDTSELRPGEAWLDLTITHDMDKLSSLTRLRQLNIRKAKAQMGGEEIEWVATHWGRLEVIRGRLNGDLGTIEARSLVRQLKSTLPHLYYAE